MAEKVKTKINEETLSKLVKLNNFLEETGMNPFEVIILCTGLIEDWAVDLVSVQDDENQKAKPILRGIVTGKEDFLNEMKEAWGEENIIVDRSNTEFI